MKKRRFKTVKILKLPRLFNKSHVLIKTAEKTSHKRSHCTRFLSSRAEVECSSWFGKYFSCFNCCWLRRAEIFNLKISIFIWFLLIVFTLFSFTSRKCVEERPHHHITVTSFCVSKNMKNYAAITFSTMERWRKQVAAALIAIMFLHGV